MATHVEGVNVESGVDQTGYEATVPLYVAAGVFGIAVLQQQRRVRLRRAPSIAPDAGADIPRFSHRFDHDVS
jgi:hypothetical protein